MQMKSRVFSWGMSVIMFATIMSFVPETKSNAAVDFIAMPIPMIDTYQNGYHIARTMYLLESSTAQNPNTVKIAVTGQSISNANNVWVLNLINWLKAKYPTANIVFQNFAIAGFSTQKLYKCVPNDMASFFPDLVILYDYGDHTLYDRMVKYIRQTIGAEVMMQTEHYTGANDWSDQMSYSLLPTIATKYGAELCRLREPWKQYLETNHLQPSALLRDGVHLNPDGQAFMLGLMKQFFVYRASNAAAVIASQTKTVLPTDWVNGKLSMTYKGTRAEVITFGSDSRFATTVLVDGKAPSTYKENYIRSAESNGMWLTNLGIINYNAVPLEQTWTVEMTSYTNETTFACKASGSISCDQGTSVANVLNGPILKLDFESFIWAYTPPTVGTKYTFTSILNGCDTYNGSNKLLFSGMPIANHKLELTLVRPGFIPDIKAIQFFDPSTNVVTTEEMPTTSPPPTPTPVATTTPTPTAPPTASPTASPTAPPVIAIDSLGLCSTLNGTYASTATVILGSALYIKVTTAGPASKLILTFPKTGYREVILPTSPRVVRIVGNNWTLLRPIIATIGAVPIRVSTSNGSVESALSSSVTANVLPNAIQSVAVGKTSDPNDTFVRVARNAPLYFKVVMNGDADKIFVNFKEANFSQAFVPGPDVVKVGNTWTIYRPLKNAWGSLEVTFKARTNGAYGPVSAPVTVVSY